MAYTSRALDLGIQAGFVRNWMFEGFPCFMFGHWLHENQARIKDKNPMHWLAAGVALCVGGGGEYLLFGSASMHIGSVLAAGCFMVYAIHANLDAPALQSGFCRKLSKLGRDLSLPVYIIHPALIMFFSSIITKEMSESNLWNWVMLLVVIGCTVLLAVGYDFCVKKVKLLKKRQAG